MPVTFIGVFLIGGFLIGVAIVCLVGQYRSIRKLRRLLLSEEAARQKADQSLMDLRIQCNSAEQIMKQSEVLQESAQACFKVLANEILEEKAKRFTEQNQTNIGQIIAPLKEDIQAFQRRLNEVHKEDIVGQTSLKSELQHLRELNLNITKEAHELTVALKGESKQQGTWGEMVLSNILERSGLREGHDFKREKSFQAESGLRRPDVIIYLPQKKHLIIDAKVSLNAYTRYVNATNELDRKQSLKEHVQAVVDRIKELSERDYFQLPGLNSPEIVFMFIPIESAFVEAFRENEALFQKAIEEQRVLVATPTTLLTSLNIVQQLWRFEEQNAHTKKLADHASKFHKKLSGFLENLLEVDKILHKSREVFDKALSQFYSGSGNLINQAKEFEKLGVLVQKKLPQDLTEKAALELEYFPKESQKNP